MAVGGGAAAVTFTGNVPLDFPSGPGVFIATDGMGDVGFPSNGVFGPTGWDIHDVRFAYDAATDTAYLGECLVSPGRVWGSARVMLGASLQAGWTQAPLTFSGAEVHWQ
jgi:hypothetical protein